MLLANLLLEDSLIDSANNVYNSITRRYALDSEETAEYNIWGRQLMDIKISILQGALGSGTLDGSQIATLSRVFSGAKLWAHVLAENMLMAYAPAVGRALMTEYPDTFLYPHSHMHGR